MSSPLPSVGPASPVTVAANGELNSNYTGGAGFIAQAGQAFDLSLASVILPPATSAPANTLTVASVASLRATSVLTTVNGQYVQTAGYYSANDGGQGLYVWNSSSTATDNGGTVIQVTGVTTGRWLLSNAGTINVRQFGAYGDNSHDDTAAIQSAINTAAASAASPRTVWFPDGTYLISSSLTYTPAYNANPLLQGGVRFIGASRDGAIITSTTNIALLAIGTTNSNIVGMDISSLTFQYSGASVTTGSIGISLVTNAFLYHAKIDNCRFNTYYGIYDGSNENAMFNVTGCYFGEDAGHGVGIQCVYGIYRYLSNGEGWLITNNCFNLNTPSSGGTGSCIYVTAPSAGDMVICGNTMEGSTNSIYVNTPVGFTYNSNYVIVGNKIDTSTTAILLHTVANSTILGNRMIGTPPVLLTGSCSGITTDLVNGGMTISGAFASGTNTSTGAMDAGVTTSQSLLWTAAQAIINAISTGGTNLAGLYLTPAAGYDGQVNTTVASDLVLLTNGVEQMRFSRSSAPMKISITLPTYANNTAALAGGLVAGQLYRNGDALNIVH